MGKSLIGRGLRVEVSKTIGAAKTVSAISNADPGVATSAAHNMAAGVVGFFDEVTGMANIDGQAARVHAPATDSFTLQGLNTTNFPAFTGGKFLPVTVWSTLSQSTSYQIGGGDANKLKTTTLLDDIEQEENGLLAAQTVSIELNHETVDPEALTLINTAALEQEYLVFRITFRDGGQRIFRGQPSMPGENTSQGGLATGSISVTVKGRVLRLPAVA